MTSWVLHCPLHTVSTRKSTYLGSPAMFLERSLNLLWALWVSSDSALALSQLVCACSATSVLSDSLRPYGLQSARFLCPWDSPCQNTGVGCHALLQGIFATQGLNLRPLSPASTSRFFTTSITREAQDLNEYWEIHLFCEENNPKQELCE